MVNQTLLITCSKYIWYHSVLLPSYIALNAIQTPLIEWQVDFLGESTEGNLHLVSRASHKGITKILGLSSSGDILSVPINQLKSSQEVRDVLQIVDALEHLPMSIVKSRWSRELAWAFTSNTLPWHPYQKAGQITTSLDVQISIAVKTHHSSYFPLLIWVFNKPRHTQAS